MTNETSRAPSSAPTAGSIGNDEKFLNYLAEYIAARPQDADRTFDILITHIDTWAGRSAGDAVPLLHEARATLKMWKDVAPAVSLCADIDKFFAAPAPGNTAQPAKAYITERAAELIRMGCSTCTQVSAVPTGMETVVVHVAPAPGKSD